MFCIVLFRIVLCIIFRVIKSTTEGKKTKESQEHCSTCQHQDTMYLHKVTYLGLRKTSLCLGGWGGGEGSRRGNKRESKNRLHGCLFYFTSFFLFYTRAGVRRKGDLNKQRKKDTTCKKQRKSWSSCLFFLKALGMQNVRIFFLQISKRVSFIRSSTKGLLQYYWLWVL